MTDILSRMLEGRSWLLADGATGTNLYNMGLAPGEAPDLWNTRHPDRVLALHSAMLEAGADLILTNSFGANRSRLRLSKAEDQVETLNLAAAKLARQAVDASPRKRKALVGGSMGPTGEIMAPMGRLTEAEAAQMFTQQAQALKDGGADLLWVETISTVEELRAAAAAARSVDMPWCGMMSFEPGGRTIMGVSPLQLASLVERLPRSPVAYGANCSTGPTELLQAVAGFAAAGSERPMIAKPNAGVPRYQDGGLIYDAGPEVMAEFAVMARDMGVRIIGGCCGTTPAHLKAMHDALEGRPQGPRPTPEMIAKRLDAAALRAEDS